MDIHVRGRTIFHGKWIVYVLTRTSLFGILNVNVRK